MEFTFDQVSEELDRNIELLKRFQIEERHDLISKQIDRLKSDQARLERLLENKSFDRDSAYSRIYFAFVAAFSKTIDRNRS